MNQSLEGKRVLVADDEQDVCFFLRRYFERRKISVSVAKDGSEAKSLLDKELFDFCLLDCSMPDITGLELIELARKRNPGAKIVLISGFPSVNDDVIKQLGGNEFIHKPIQLKELDAIF
ncbi:MAG TPA: response regulator [Candidatus Omnitrophota bacterium]|nr:response regulator [Candidatus Omnitrophota bacterium]